MEDSAVTKTYTLKGLDCANCAARIERSVRALDGIQAVTVNPVTGILNVEYADHLTGKISALVEQSVHKSRSGRHSGGNGKSGNRHS